MLPRPLEPQYRNTGASEVTNMRALSQTGAARESKLTALTTNQPKTQVLSTHSLGHGPGRPRWAEHHTQSARSHPCLHHEVCKSRQESFLLTLASFPQTPHFQFLLVVNSGHGPEKPPKFNSKHKPRRAQSRETESTLTGPGAASKAPADCGPPLSHSRLTHGAL